MKCRLGLEIFGLDLQLPNAVTSGWSEGPGSAQMELCPFTLSEDLGHRVAGAVKNCTSNLA